ncbi:uncharacterized protein PHACADRAFT_53412, partial [Phanerochaete carnosa HHB-10118-sp]
YLRILPWRSSRTSKSCYLCQRKVQIYRMRGHVDQHILWARRSIEDVSLKTAIGLEPCGFCGRDRTCFTQLRQKAGRGQGYNIISNCLYHYQKMNYTSAKNVTKTSPCTNVPIHCVICPSL